MFWSQPAKVQGEWYINMKLKYRLACIYVITAVLPVIVLLTFSYAQMRDILIERDTKNIQSFVNQAGASVDSQLEIYNNLSNYIAFNETISRIVSYDYKSDYEMYSQLVSIFDPMLLSLKYFHDDVNQVTIYTDGDIKHDTTLAPVSEIKDEKWFASANENTQIQWFADSRTHSLISARKMSVLYRENVTGILYINVDYDSVFKPFTENTEDNYGIYIVDSHGGLVYGYNRFAEEYVDKELDFESFCGLQKENGGKHYTIISQELETADWTVYIYEPKKLVLRSAKPMILVIFVAAAVIFAGAVIAIAMTSRFLLARVKQLQQNMREVEKGNFSVRIHSDKKDELGELMNGFDHMVSSINTLITEVYESRINQKEYEMRALRAQINPHFLYNSLSLINWKALESDREDISRITLELSNYYRTSLNKGKNTLTLEQELSNMRSYLHIQQLMHDDGFDVVVDVEERILGFESLNLILQPLVENAIEHGIDLKTDGRGCITVRGWLDEECNEIYLTVSDNGVGMDCETAASFLTAKTNGYGARNVNERIKLYYGEEYQLKVQSTPGEGTDITIRFPARKMKE